MEHPTRSILRVPVISLKIAAVLAGFLIVTVLVLVRSDEVEERYSTLAAARAAQLFERGWLPDVLPNSTDRLRVSVNFDLNTADGEFYFAPTDWNQFTKHLLAGVAGKPPFVGWPEASDKYRRKGFTVWSHSGSDANWLFLCKAENGYCEYLMWQRRES
jgi:hypothetical protein